MGTAMGDTLYTTGEYLALHPTWHVEDSEWKARQIHRMLRRNAVEPRSVTEVGCGAGAVLAELQCVLNAGCELVGYDVSPQAVQMCRPRENERLHYRMGDYLREETEKTDLMLLIDVVEHIEDYMGFLRALRGRAEYMMIHVPLDLSLQSLLRGTPEKVRRSAGHLHYFTRRLFLQSLHDCGYTLIDWSYTGAGIELPASSIAMSLAKRPRQLLFRLNQDAASLILGGFSLMVLAQG